MTKVFFANVASSWTSGLQHSGVSASLITFPDCREGSEHKKSLESLKTKNSELQGQVDALNNKIKVQE